MSVLHRVSAFLKLLFRRAKVEAELDAEVQAFYETMVDRYVERGLPRQEARRLAHLKFNPPEQVKEEVRDARTGAAVASLAREVKYALRTIRKTPAFAVVTVLTLALGIGVNTAIFSVLDSVLLRTLPVAHPEELVVLTDPDSHGSNFGGEGGERSLLAYSEYQYLRDHNEVFSHIFAADSQLPEVELTIGNASAGSHAQADTARIRLVSGDYFETLGVSAAAGQVFTPEVDRARGGAPIAVISYAFWKQSFGLDPSILGRTIRTHNSSFEIVGVSPPGFFGETVGQAADVWVPITMQDVIYPGRDLLTA